MSTYRRNVFDGFEPEPKIHANDQFRVLIGGLPKPVEREMQRLQQEFADNHDEEGLRILDELQWMDNPCERARRDAKLAHAKRDHDAKMFDLQVEAAQHGLVLRNGQWVDVDDVLPRGIPNRHRR